MATTISYGECSKCGKRNPQSLTNCRDCGALLPWVKPAKAKVAASQRMADTSLEPVIFILGGILIFVVSCCVPILGYRVYRYFAEEESGLAGFAGAGALLGLLAWLLVFVAEMAKVGKTPS